METVLRPHQLPPDSTLADDDALLADSPTRGTRRLSPADFSAAVLRAGGDSVYYRADAMDVLVAAQNARLDVAEEQSTQAMQDAGIASTRSADASDTADAALALAQAAAASATGFPIEDYLGEVIYSYHDPGAASAHPGKWYSVAIDATLSATPVSGMIVKPGDRILSNGTAWVRWQLPPGFLTPGSVQRMALEPRLRQLLTDMEDPEWAMVCVDTRNRIAYGLRHDGTFVPSKIELPASSVSTEKLEDAAVTRAKLTAEIEAGLVKELLSVDYAWAVVDAEGHIGIAIKFDGTVEGKFLLPDSSVTGAKLAAATVPRAKLDSSLASSIPVEVSDSMEFVWSIVDEDDRVAFGIRRDGTAFLRPDWTAGTISGSAIITGSVPRESLNPAASRLAFSGSGEWVSDAFDNLRRGQAVDFSAVTDTGAGYAFRPFPTLPTPVLYGVNASGTALLFRRAPRHVIRGTNDRGAWAAGPSAPAASATEGDFWTVSSGGTYDGVTYTTGDRIHCVGTNHNGGSSSPLFLRGKAGEFWLKGEFTPSGFSPASPVDGDAWQASTSGTFGGLTYAAGDLVLRVSGAWLQVLTSTVSVANGVAWRFDVRDASEIEVRRSDGSTTPVDVTCTGYRTSNPRQSSDGVILRGDSMVATGGLNTALADVLQPRTLVALSYAGANYSEVLATAKREIGLTDPYRGWTHIWFAGQNNSPNLEPVKRGALEASALCGARDGRCVIMSTNGQHSLTWNGTRLVGSQHEPRFAGSGNLAAFEAWAAKVFPGRFFNTTSALLAAAGSLPHLQFPGMTEAQVAATYGVLPFSFYFNLAAVGWTPAGLSFQGYRSTAGLPSGGSDGHYYLRSANGTVGGIIVRWGGAWSEPAIDITHMYGAGNAALASALASFLSANLI